MLPTGVELRAHPPWPSKPPVVNGTTQLGACDSVAALTAEPTRAFVCLGTASTDFGRLRVAYKKGGVKAAQAESSREANTTVATATSGQQLLTMQGPDRKPTMTCPDDHSREGGF